MQQSPNFNFKMVFNNRQIQPSPNNNLGHFVQKTVNINKQIPLHGSMISRINTAKSGCSACGKKVA
jgi:hypothetical protein